MDSSTSANNQTTTPIPKAQVGGATRSPVAWTQVAKINGRTTAALSWLASGALLALADTRTMAPRPKAATAGVTQKMSRSHCRVGTNTRCMTGQATVLATTA